MKYCYCLKFLFFLFAFLVVLPTAVLAGDIETDGELGAIIIPIDSIKRHDSTSYWRFVGRTRLNVNTILLSYWTDGGESYLTGAGSFDVLAAYKKGKLKFETNFKSAMGIQAFQNTGIKKTDDRLDLTSILGTQISERWFFNLNTNFSTQYIKGYSYPNDSVLVSNFLSPAFLSISLGFEYKPFKALSLYASPLAGKVTFVKDQFLADNGKYGVVPAAKDTLGNVLIPGKRRKSELGLSFIANYKGKITRNTDLNSKLVLYNNYFDLDKSNRWNIDVDWETWLDFTLNKFFVASAYFHVVYDHDMKIPVFDEVDGERAKVGETIHLQLKQNYGLGIAFKF